jgi:hypothetical protein
VHSEAEIDRRIVERVERIALEKRGRLNRGPARLELARISSTL